MPTALFKGGVTAAERARGARRAGRGRGSHRPARREHADRSRPGAGLHDAADQRDRHAAGEDRRHRLGRRSASRPATITIENGGVHRRADRRRLLEPAGQDRSAARQGAHRQHHACSTTTRARCRSPATWRSTSCRSAASSCTSTPNDFKVIDNKLGNVRVNSDLRDRRRAARAAHRRRPRHLDRPASISIRSWR